jgi:hypothetical protein
MRMMGLAKWCVANGTEGWNNGNLSVPPTVERSVLLIGEANKRLNARPFTPVAGRTSSLLCSL